jgi:hypothetical protein
MQQVTVMITVAKLDEMRHYGGEGLIGDSDGSD